MEKRLKWNAIGLESKIELLHDAISKEKEKIPEEHTKNHRKLKNYLDDLQNLIDKISLIKTELLEKLQKILRIEFPTPELLMIALARPSVKNIFDDLKKHFQDSKINPVKIGDYDDLISIGEASKVLALIGDSALDLAAVQLFWDSQLSTVGELSRKRQEIVSNKNLARICDKWKLYDYRLKRKQKSQINGLKEETIEHVKGTFVEAIFGVIYLEFGLEEVFNILILLQ